MAEDASQAKMVLQCFAPTSRSIAGQPPALLPKPTGRQKMSRTTRSFCPEYRGLGTDFEPVSTLRREIGVYEPNYGVVGAGVHRVARHRAKSSSGLRSRLQFFPLQNVPLGRGAKSAIA